MPLADYECRDCGAIVRDHYFPMVEGATASAPYCPSDTCAGFRTRMRWIPQVGRMDAGGGSSFTAFTFQQRQADGSYREVQVNSVHQMRQIERQSEQAARNGEGEAVRFRMWSQDAANGDTNSFGPDPSVQARAELAAMRQAAVEAGARKREARLSAAVGETARQAAETLGPGVTEATASPLSLGD